MYINTSNSFTGAKSRNGFITSESVLLDIMYLSSFLIEFLMFIPTLKKYLLKRSATCLGFLAQSVMMLSTAILLIGL